MLDNSWWNTWSKLFLKNKQNNYQLSLRKGVIED